MVGCFPSTGVHFFFTPSQVFLARRFESVHPPVTLNLSTADFGARNGRTPTGLPCSDLRELPDTPQVKQQAKQEAKRGGKLTRRTHKPPPGLDGAVFTRPNLLAASSEH